MGLPAVESGPHMTEFTPFQDLDGPTRRKRMEKTIRAYFDGCDEADVEKMAATFHPDAVHYFPPGPDGPGKGARTIAENWRRWSSPSARPGPSTA